MAGLKNPDDAAAAPPNICACSRSWYLPGSGPSRRPSRLKNAIRAGFYDAKLATARFYFAKVLPGTTSLLQSLTSGVKPIARDFLKSFAVNQFVVPVGIEILDAREPRRTRI